MKETPKVSFSQQVFPIASGGIVDAKKNHAK